MNNEIEPKDLVYNEEFYDSDEVSESSDNYDSETSLKDYSSCDEDTEDLREILEDILKEIATVDALGKNVLKVNFYKVKNLELLPKKTACDFDEDENGYPIILDEEYFIPYMYEVLKVNKNFKGISIETNLKNCNFVL